MEIKRTAHGCYTLNCTTLGEDEVLRYLFDAFMKYVRFAEYRRLRIVLERPLCGLYYITSKTTDDILLADAMVDGVEAFIASWNNHPFARKLNPIIEPEKK